MSRVRVEPEQDVSQLDADAVKNCAESVGYRWIVERLRAIERDKLRELRGDLDPAKTAEVRGYLRAIERVLSVPGELVSEAKNAKTTKTKERLE